MSDTPAPRYGAIDADYAARLATTAPEADGPVWMVNLMSYRDVADYGDGRGSSISGREADDRYTPLESLEGVGAEIVFAAEVQDQFLGDTPRWDRVAVVRYPTRRSFIEMQSRPDFQRQHVHKDAGMAETIVMGCRPMPAPGAGLDLPDWAEVPHPPADGDGPVVVIHVVRYVEEAAAGASPEEMEAYTAAAAQVAVPHGGRIEGWFEVEGTIVGDGRAWDQVRFNAFPSRAAFLAVVSDPARLEAQRTHRDTAIADTYTLVTRPMVNRVAASIA